MILTNNLESTGYNSELEQWEPLLNEILHSLENGDFLLNREWTVLVEHHTEDVLPLDNGNALIDHVSGNPI